MNCMLLGPLGRHYFMCEDTLDNSMPNSSTTILKEEEWKGWVGKYRGTLLDRA